MIKSSHLFLVSLFIVLHNMINEELIKHYLSNCYRNNVYPRHYIYIYPSIIDFDVIRYFIRLGGYIVIINVLEIDAIGISCEDTLNKVSNKIHSQTNIPFNNFNSKWAFHKINLLNDN